MKTTLSTKSKKKEQDSRHELDKLTDDTKANRDKL
jgi:hypothetical protein